MKRLLVAFLLFLFAAPAFAQTEAVKADFFEKKIRPIFAEHCISCHGPSKQKGGVRLDLRDSVIKGEVGGEALLIGGDPKKGLLLKAVRHEGDIKMPPKNKLPPAAIDDLATWVKLGADWPVDKTLASKNEKNHWAFQSVRKPAIPKVSQQDWQANPIDAFVLEKLQAK